MVAPAAEQAEVLAEIENDLLDLTARSFRIWEKLRSLKPSTPPVQETDLQQFKIHRFHIDLSSKSVRPELAACKDLEDVLGGIARAFKILEERPIDDPYDPAATLVMNLGILSGTQFMTGLRTYFHAYSPLKTSKSGKPSAMWSAGSGKFGTKLRYAGIDEIFFEGRCSGPTMLHITRPDPQGPPVFKFEDASFLAGRRVNDKIQTLYRRYPNAHFAVIGPAGEAYKQVRYAAIALSTENQLKSGDSKPRFCGRGGIGGVMGSKNLLAIIADVVDPPMEKAPPELKPINVEVARGKGSAKLRDKKKGGLGGTWANYEALNPVHAMPEMNFVPTGTDASVPLYRDNVEAEGRFIVKDEACYRCGIACHKNVYNMGRDNKPGRFRAKLDFEPLNLLSSNIGIFDVDDACELVALVDEMGMDSISCGVTLSYVMEYNKRHAGNGSMIADGLQYGDFEGARRAIENIGLGRMELLGQGVKRLSEQLQETDYAAHVKGVELPAYLPQTNPGYPWALAGGHMSMRTYLLYVFEKETSVDYWVEAILKRGIQILRDDFLGVCKFANLDDESMCTAVRALTGLELTVDQLQRVIRRTFLRGYRLERRQGFTDDDYVLPKMAHEKYDQIQLPYFNSPQFFQELKDRVLHDIDRMLVEENLQEARA